MPTSKKRDYYLWFAVAASVAGLALAGVLVWPHLPAHVFSHEAVVKAPAPAAQGQVAPSDPQQALTHSLSRLGDALDSFPGQKPEEILRLVAVKGKACHFQWNDGQPSLMYGAGKSISTTLDQCSDAVERFH